VKGKSEERRANCEKKSSQYRVRRGSVEGCRVAQMRVWCGSVDSVQHGSVRVRCDSVQDAA